MALKENFLQEAKIGSYVELMVGSKEISGVIMSLDTATVKIKTANGKEPTISLENIALYEISDTPASKGQDAVSSIIQERGPAQEKTQVEKLASPAMVIDRHSIGMDENSNTSTQVEDNGENFFRDAKSPEVKPYKWAAQMSKSPELIAIANSLNYAIEKSHEGTPADTKIQDNIKKLNRLISADRENPYPADMLGALYYQCKGDRLALDAYMNGNDDESAFAVAQSINSQEYMEIFACRHLINSTTLNPFIAKWLADRIISTDDYSILEKLTPSKITTNQKAHGTVAFIKALLLARHIDYNSLLKYNLSKSSVFDLIHYYDLKRTGSKKKMMGHLPAAPLQKNETIPQMQIVANKPTESLYISAQKAREQKDFVTAERLFIQAIKNNEKISQSASELVYLMLQARNLEKAVKYLETYGPKCMKEETYRNVTKYLANIKNTWKQKPITPPKEESSKDYFAIAQKADLEEKDLQKAITYYNEAINRNQRLTASIPNLASIYTRLEMYDEALSLLDTMGHHLDRIKCLNLKITLFKAAKNRKYKKDIMDTYDEAIALSNSKEKKADLLCAEAHGMNIIGEYEDSIRLFLKFQKKINEGIYAGIKKSRQQLNVLRGLCNAYFRTEQYALAKEYAGKVLRIQPENEFAKSVLSGEISDELEDITDTTGVTKISEYLIQRIDKLNLENELKDRTMIADGVFTGTAGDAARIIDGIFYSQVRTSVNDEIQSNNYFAIAKLIRQVLDQDVDSKPTGRINEWAYQLQVAIGSYFYGNYRLYRTEMSNNFDTARYCLFESILIFRDAEKKHKCWAAATIRYIQTFFYSPSEIKEEDSKLYYTLSDYEKEYPNKINDVMQRNIQISPEDFIVGMIEMLAHNSKVKALVLKNILHHDMAGDILEVVSAICDEPIPENISDELFREIWDRSTRSYYTKRGAFLRLVEETIESVFTVGQLQDNCERLNNSDFIPFLNQTDKEYLKTLQKIVENLRKYSENSEFSFKADSLEQADNSRKQLEEKIADYPTYIGYEKIRVLLEKLQAKIFRESTQFYGDNAPDITVKLSGDCAIDEEKMIAKAPLSFINKNNVQTADNFAVQIESDRVSVLNDEQLARSLLVGDGKAYPQMVEFQISPEILEEQEFSARVNIHYQYKINMTEKKDAEQEIPLSIRLYSESSFTEIDNKFEPYRNGAQVEEPSMFYGRDKDIENIIQQISDESGNVLRGKCLALYGQTRTGKSSLLYHLEQKLREINPEGNVIINVGSIGNQDLSGDITEFLYTLLDELEGEITSRHPQLKTILHEADIHIDAEKLLEHREQAQLYFNSAFRDINRCLEAGHYNYNIIVMIDEFTYIYDWIRKGVMTDRIMKFWKAFIQNNGVFAIIIGQDHMMKFINEEQFTNDFGSTHLKKVTYLPEEDAKKLMDEPILIYENGSKKSRYLEDSLDRLYELTAGSAFLIMNLCAGLVDYLNENHFVYITPAAIEDYLRKNLASFEEARFFEPQYADKSRLDLEKANEENKQILRRIAHSSNKKEWAPLDSVVRSEEDKALIDALAQRDVVTMKEGRCKIKVALYKEWILARDNMEGNYA